MNCKTLSYKDLKITVEDFSDMFNSSTDNSCFMSELEEVIESATSWIKPMCYIQLFDCIEIKEDQIQIEAVTFDCGKKITKQLNLAQKLAVFVCTVGSGPTIKYKEYINENDLLKAYYADALGSVAVEKAMDIFQQEFGKELESENLKTSNRYSPGYCGWLVGEQQKLFSLLTENPCGVLLTDSSLMQPIKSISGVIGAGSRINHTAHACHICDFDKCLYGKRKK